MKVKVAKYIKKYILLIFLLVVIFNIKNNIYSATRKEGIENFPASYQVYLNKLKAKHPNWNFTALYTGIDFNTAVKYESILSGNKTISLSPIKYDRIWHHVYNNSSYSSSDNKWTYSYGDLLYQHENGWVTSSINAVKYTMDPRNFLNEQHIFQFENLSYNNIIHTEAGVEEILRGTEMYQTKISYYDTNKNKINTDITYAAAFIQAAIYANVSPYNLAARTRNETGCLISSNKALSGKTEGYDGYYNYFSIGAHGDPSPVINGLKYAKNAGWTSPLIAMKEGAKFLANNYISKGQDTLYLQKFNITNSPYYQHQYMTDITCVFKEAQNSIYKAYNNMAILNNGFNFVIPVYENMDSSTDIYVKDNNAFEEDTAVYTLKNTSNLLAMPISSSPILDTVASGTKITMTYSGLESSAYNKVRLASGLEGYIHYTNFNIVPTTDNTIMSVINAGTLNVRSGPSTASSVIAKISDGTVITRIQKYSTPLDVKDTRIWDKIRLQNGTTGYVCRVDTDSTVYLKKVSYVKVTAISLDKETLTVPMYTTANLIATIYPSNAEYKGVTWQSSDENILKVSNTGTITPVAIGTAKITVTTNDQSEVATCNVQVINKNLGIKFEKPEYEILIGSEITPKISYTEANVTAKYTLTSEDNTLVQVNGNVIKAITPGTTKLYAKVNETLEETQTTIKVVEKLTNYYEFNSPLVIDTTTNILTKINPGTVVSDLLTKISSDFTIKILKPNKIELKPSESPGTGSIVQIKNNDTLINDFTIVIYGDVSGDSKITASDYVLIKNHIMGQSTISSPYIIAADVDKNSKITASDYVLIKNHIMGKSAITQ